jgi:hypothetical protein
MGREKSNLRRVFRGRILNQENTRFKRYVRYSRRLSRLTMRENLDAVINEAIKLKDDEERYCRGYLDQSVFECDDITPEFAEFACSNGIIYMRDFFTTHGAEILGNICGFNRLARQRIIEKIMRRYRGLATKTFGEKAKSLKMA